MGSPFRVLPAAPLSRAGGAVPYRAHPAVRSLAALALVGLFAAHPALALPAGPTAEQIQEFLRTGRYARAETTARALLTEAEPLHGANSIEVAEVLDLLVEAMRLGGKAGEPETRAVCERAIRIKEAVLGPDHQGTARSLASLGILLTELGQYAEAGRVLSRALDIRQRALGPDHPDVARTLMCLAVAEDEAGRDSTAIPLVERAIEIQRAVLPPNDPALAQSLNVLASFAFYRGDYARAGPLYEEALAIFARSRGPNHPQVAQCHHNLASVDSELGDEEGGLGHLEKALAIRRRALGPQHPLLGTTLVSLGTTLETLGDPAGARARYEQGLRILEHAYGTEHTLVAWTLMRLGRLDVGAGRYSSARDRLARALGVQERLMGTDHPDLSWALSSLAAVQEAEDDDAAARHSYERGLEVLERAYGPVHPDRIRVLNDYAGFLARAGDSTRALKTALASSSARSEQLRWATRGLAERQALKYLAFGTAGLDLAVRLAARGIAGTGGIGRVWDAVIRSRTLVLDEMASRQRIAATAAGDTTLATAVRAVDGARRRYATFLVRGAVDEDVELHRARLDRARDAMEAAERGLAAVSLPFRAGQTQARIGLEDVLAAIPADAALVSFAVRDTGTAETCVAFIGRPGAEPRAVSLGRARAVDAAIDRWTREIASAPADDRGAAARDAEESCRRSGAVLRRLVWDPIAEGLGPVSRIFLVPDGALYRVNFAALPEGTGEYLADAGPLFHVLTSERDLVAAAQGPPPREGLLALGGPSFDRRGTGAGVSDRERLSRSPRTRGSTPDARGPLPDCTDFRAVRFESLPASIREVEEVAGLWSDTTLAVVLTGARATEAALRELGAGKRVLHLATHGFFLDGAHCAAGVGRRGIGGISIPDRPGTPPAPARAASTRAASPLRLSGLALAGANLRNDADSGGDDGILTAEEVASIDLTGTEWAVLSACDTGVGRVQSGEGVLGLRRAFQIAGARAVIMSLWPVEDQATRRWMRALYEGRFRHGLGTADAVREAGRSVLREQRAQRRSTHPFYWAGFVAAGDWR